MCPDSGGLVSADVVFFMVFSNGLVAEVVNSLIGICSINVRRFEVEYASESLQVERVDTPTLCLCEINEVEAIHESRLNYTVPIFDPCFTGQSADPPYRVELVPRGHSFFDPVGYFRIGMVFGVEDGSEVLGLLDGVHKGTVLVFWGGAHV